MESTVPSPYSAGIGFLSQASTCRNSTVTPAHQRRELRRREPQPASRAGLGVLRLRIKARDYSSAPCRGSPVASRDPTPPSSHASGRCAKMARIPLHLHRARLPHVPPLRPGAHPHQDRLPGVKLYKRGRCAGLRPWRPSLIVTTDRMSAFDVIMVDSIPGKGQVLTALSQHWFDSLKDIVPNHSLGIDVSTFPAEQASPGGARRPLHAVREDRGVAGGVRGAATSPARAGRVPAFPGDCAVSRSPPAWNRQTACRERSLPLRPRPRPYDLTSRASRWRSWWARS